MRTRDAALLLVLAGFLPFGCAASPAPAAARDAAPAAGDAAAEADVAPTGGRPGPATAVIPAVPLGQPFRLAFDHLVRAGDTGVRLRFAKLIEDSRCPRGAVCVWAGRARVQVEVIPRDADQQAVELGTDQGATTVSAAGLTLELQGVEPLRAVGEQQRPAPEAYTLTLVARRSG